jgi:hypothetical protein
MTREKMLKKIEGARKRIGGYYRDYELKAIPIELSEEQKELGRYYYGEEEEEAEVLAHAMPSLRPYLRKGQKIVLSPQVFEETELGHSYGEVETLEVVLHHEMLHYLIDRGEIHWEGEDMEVWIDETLKSFYRGNDESVKKYPDLPPSEARRMPGLIERFNKESGFRREIMMMGNSMVARGDGAKTAEAYLAMMAMMSRY